MLCAAGTDSQRLLVATMRRLTPAVMMMAINHKGRIIYANTQLANMLGYKLKALK
jgi:PAS domain S-box-containing protein